MITLAHRLLLVKITRKHLYQVLQITLQRVLVHQLPFPLSIIYSNSSLHTEASKTFFTTLSTNSTLIQNWDNTTKHSTAHHFTS